VAVFLLSPGLDLVILLVLGIVLAAIAVRVISDRSRSRELGRIVAVDRSVYHAPPLRSTRYRIVGKPDEIRRRADGAQIPVELKSRATPRGGPPPSHRIQVYTYCLLLEETTGRPPPFGVVRYGDGGEFRLPWDGAARTELLGIVAQMRQRYDGRASPSPGKCRGCRFRAGCDRRAA
jgi:CRISPR-associated exonuclease Cas4